MNRVPQARRRGPHRRLRQGPVRTAVPTHGTVRSHFHTHYTFPGWPRLSKNDSNSLTLKVRCGNNYKSITLWRLPVTLIATLVSGLNDFLVIITIYVDSIAVYG